MVPMVHVEHHLTAGRDTPDAPWLGQQGADRHDAGGFVPAQRCLPDLHRAALDLEPDDAVVGHRVIRSATGRTCVGLGTSNRLPVLRRAPVSGSRPSTVTVPLSWLATYTESSTTVRSRGMSPPQSISSTSSRLGAGPGSTRKLATVFGPRLAMIT